MEQTPDNAHFVTCRCQRCDGGIEFEVGDFEKGETLTAECPHCHMETIIFVPAAAAPGSVPPPLPESLSVAKPVWFGSAVSVVEVRLVSGVTVKIKEIRLYNASQLNYLAAQKANAAELLSGVSNPYGAIGDPLWVVFTTKITGMLEQKLSREAAQKGNALLVELAERERRLRRDVKFFPVGQVQEIENAMPSLWVVPSSPSNFVHSGEEFVTVKDSEGTTNSIRWSSVECYNYQPNK